MLHSSPPLLVTDDERPSMILPETVDRAFLQRKGTGEKRFVEPSNHVGLHDKLICHRKPSYGGNCVLVVGNSQFRTLTQEPGVWCPPNWYVLSIPGGSSQHCRHAIGYAEEHLDLDRARVGSIVLMPGTNHLGNSPPHVWEREMHSLLNECIGRFPGAPILFVGPAPRHDGMPVSDLIRIMGTIAADFSSRNKPV